MFVKDTIISAEEIQIFEFGLDEQIEEHSHFYQGGKTMDDFVKEIILREIERCNGNRVQAARNLKIAKSTLHAKLKEYGVGPKYSNEIISERNVR